MVQKKLKYIDTPQLRKKKKVTSMIAKVLISLHATCMTLVVLDTIGITEFGRTTLIPGLVFIFIALPLIYRVRNLDVELKKRESI